MEVPGPEERRAVPERRRYARRTTAEATPDYHAIFERIAVALEAIADTMNAPETTHEPVRPRTSRES